MNTTFLRRGLIVVLVALPLTGSAGERARAHVECAATDAKLIYECTVKLTGKKSGQPIVSESVRIKADMPSMPMAHNVPAATASPAPGMPGTYEMTLELEMLGEWVLAIDVNGRTADAKVHDKVIVKRHFGDEMGMMDATKDAKKHSSHGHQTN